MRRRLSPCQPIVGLDHGLGRVAGLGREGDEERFVGHHQVEHARQELRVGGGARKSAGENPLAAKKRLARSGSCVMNVKA